MSPDPIVLGAYTSRVLRLELLALALLAVLALAWASPDLLAWLWDDAPATPAQHK